MGAPLKIIYEQVNPRWEVAVCLSAEKGFQQVSFVNSIATTKVSNFTAILHQQRFLLLYSAKFCVVYHLGTVHQLFENLPVTCMPTGQLLPLHVGPILSHFACIGVAPP